MQYLTPDPDEHSTKEKIRWYHEHEGDIDVRTLFPKLLAAITTVGVGGGGPWRAPALMAGVRLDRGYEEAAGGLAWRVETGASC